MLYIYRFSGFEKDVVMLIKKSTDTPFNSFIGKGVIDLPPQEVYDSIRNPQLRFIYDNMLKVGGLGLGGVYLIRNRKKLK